MLDSVGGPPRGMFDGCRTQTEVIVAVHAMLGLAAVEQLLSAACDAGAALRNRNRPDWRNGTKLLRGRAAYWI
jgi:hypothetical protein